MMIILQSFSLRRALIWRVFEVIIFIILVIAAGQIYFKISDLRFEVLSKQHKLEELPNMIMHFSDLQKELRGREADIGRIGKMVLDRNDVTYFIEFVENAAKNQNVTVSFSDLNEPLSVGDNGKPIEPTGYLRDVRMQVVSSGTPVDLIELLHELEYAPYLTRLEKWEIRMGKERNQYVSALMARTVQGGEENVVKAAGTLEVIVVLHVHNDQYAVK